METIANQLIGEICPIGTIYGLKDELHIHLVPPEHFVQLRARVATSTYPTSAARLHLGLLEMAGVFLSSLPVRKVQVASA